MIRLSYACPAGVSWAAVESSELKDDCPLCGAFVASEAAEPLSSPLPLERFSSGWLHRFDQSSIIPDGQTIDRLGARLRVTDDGSIEGLNATWLDLPAAPLALWPFSGRDLRDG